MPSPLVRVVVAAGAWVLINPIAAFAEPAGRASAPSVAGRAGNWVQVDPQTGQRVPAPARNVALPPNPAFSSAHSGLVEEPSTGGGMMIDLQGRFRSAATATVGADGKAHVECVPPSATGGTSRR